MHLNPYGEDPIVMTIELIRHRPKTATDLERITHAHGVVVRGRVTRADVELVDQVLDEWLQVVDAEQPDHRARLLNVMLEKYSTQPTLTDHAESGWHLHFRPAAAPVGRVVATLVSVGTAMHLAGRGMHRLGRCAAADCGEVYADISRNGRQRYCSPACANRDAVRRHRAKASHPVRSISQYMDQSSTV